MKHTDACGGEVITGVRASQVLKSLDYEKTAVDLVEVAVHSRQERAHISSFLLSQVRPARSAVPFHVPFPAGTEAFQD